MKTRQNLIGYALETVPRPGMRETRVRRPPAEPLMRNARGRTDETE